MLGSHSADTSLFPSISGFGVGRSGHFQSTTRHTRTWIWIAGRREHYTYSMQAEAGQASLQQSCAAAVVSPLPQGRRLL